MEFVEGEKITDAFPEDGRLRQILARRLSDVLTYEVLFSKAERAIFHGDPHAGNVFHVTAHGTDPYRIALLDWGLSGSFDRNQRKDLVQLLVGLYLNDGKRLRNHVGVLVEGGLPSSQTERLRINALIESSLQNRGTQDSFAVLQSLITNLAQEGYKIPFDLALFIKSQLTIAGILSELDPELRQDDQVMGRLQNQVFKELPKRLLYALSIVGWNSHDYRSLLSNEDVRDVEMKRLGIQRALRSVWAVVRYPARILGF
jgi:ubiquinone biosynthesis protein